MSARTLVAAAAFVALGALSLPAQSKESREAQPKATQSRSAPAVPDDAVEVLERATERIQSAERELGQAKRELQQLRNALSRQQASHERELTNARRELEREQQQLQREQQQLHQQLQREAQQMQREHQQLRQQLEREQQQHREQLERTERDATKRRESVERDAQRRNERQVHLQQQIEQQLQLAQTELQAATVALDGRSVDDARASLARSQGELARAIQRANGHGNKCAPARARIVTVPAKTTTVTTVDATAQPGAQQPCVPCQPPACTATAPAPAPQPAPKPQPSKAREIN